MNPLPWFASLDPIAQALIAGTFTWLVTALGAATVVLSRHLPKALLDAVLGFAPDDGPRRGARVAGAAPEERGLAHRGASPGQLPPA